LTEPLKFDVQDILASNTRASIACELATRIKATGKVMESPFAIILTVSGGAITRFQMLARQLRGFQGGAGLKK
jgi:uncharacterized protein